jgi:hypothetical protein
MKEQRNRRVEKRKFKRISVRFGLEAPTFKAAAVQISTKGFFLSTNHPVYPPGSHLSIEITTPSGSHTVAAVVRHARQLPRRTIQYERSGMGVEFLDLPQGLLDYLVTLCAQ